MNEAAVLDVARQGASVALMVTLPLLSVALFVGLAVSVFQAVTQVQEMTLTFVPKMVGAILVVLGMGGWMLTTLVQFLRACLDQASHVVR